MPDADRVPASPSPRPHSHGSVRRPSAKVAFSLIELMVAVGLLTFIILGLLAMFSQTQRAFRSSITQTDVLESGRATMDLLTRELQEMTPSHCPELNVSGVIYRATNFFVEPFPTVNPLYQDLPGNNTMPRANVLQRFYFLSRVNQDWIGTGYEVWPDDANGCVGTLYRYTGTNQSRTGPFATDRVFVRLWPTNLNRVADGVVHLKVRAFAPNGFPIVADNLYTNAFYRTNPASFYPPQGHSWVRYAAAYPQVIPGHPNNAGALYYWQDAVPAYIEVELGILEPQVLQRYRSIPVPTAALQYLSNHAAQVHLFRQRIPIRNVDSSAYPQ